MQLRIEWRSNGVAKKAIVHALEAGMFIIRVVFAVQGTSRDDFTKLCKLAQDLY